MYSERLPADHDVQLLEGHRIADGLGKDAGLVCWEVLGLHGDRILVPGDNVGLDAGNVHLAHILVFRRGGRVVAILAGIVGSTELVLYVGGPSSKNRKK